MSNLFQKLELEAFRAGINPRTRESRDWFRRKVQGLRGVSRTELMQEDEITLANKSQPLIGSMNMFFYDPKHKETLPFYDRFPLAIIVGPAEKGFYGLNLHYLPPVLRAKLLDSLMDITNNKKYDETTRFQVSYKVLQAAAKFRYYKPCLKHYLTAHVKSRLARVQAPEWEIATFLPTADWAKQSSRQVYTKSRQAI
jgi:hypothetical protein